MMSSANDADASAMCSQLSRTIRIRLSRRKWTRPRPGVSERTSSPSDEATTVGSRRIAQRRQVDEADALVAGFPKLVGNGERHRRFADAAGPHQRDEAPLRQLRPERSHDLRAAYWPCERPPQWHVRDAGAIGGDWRLGRRRHRLEGLRDRRHKAVSAPGFAYDVPGTRLSLAKQLAQRGDVYADIGLGHGRSRPSKAEQLLLADKLARMLDEGHQDVEGAVADPGRLITIEEQTLSGIEPEGTERQTLHHRPSLSAQQVSTPPLVTPLPPKEG
jgi:hypothetical protein